MHIPHIKDIVRLSKRALKHFIQRYRFGFDDSETWSLDHSLAKLILPRLKRFKEKNNGAPFGLTFEVWNYQIDEMIFAFECIASDNYFDSRFDEHTENRIKAGLYLFAMNYRSLWW